MDKKDLEKRIKNFDFSFLKYINPETKELSNKVILFSCICIFLNFGYLTISELEITGLKVEIKQSFLSIVLFFINTYYFLQFKNSIKIDLILAKIPNEFTEISEEVIEAYNKLTLKSDTLIQEYKNALQNEDFTKQTTIQLDNKTEQIKNNKTVKLLQYWVNEMIKSNKYRKQNMWLNHYFPNFCFIVSFISIVFYLCNSYCN